MKVQASLDDRRPNIPHDDVMAHMARCPWLQAIALTTTQLSIGDRNSHEAAMGGKE
ncbi:hypothetical protein [Paraburkholderia sp. GAS206C]|uniref:antitoxin PaaA2 family protein n=1 Tax=unclassified Paraburkholderia TaxID=2615204 RepID=UPI003D1C3537